MRIEKANFKLASAARDFGDEASVMYALHITREKTEVTNGSFVVSMLHSPQKELALSLDPPLDVLMDPQDALNIASSLGKDDYVQLISVAADRKTMQVEFNTGEIRILPVPEEQEKPYPNTAVHFPADAPMFSVSLEPSFLVAVLQAFIAGKCGSGVMFEFRGNTGAVCLRPSASLTPGEPEVAALLMAQRSEASIDLPVTVSIERSRAKTSKQDVQ